MASNSGKPIKVMNDQAKPGVPPINTPEGMYTPDWDNPNVQTARVLPKSEQPRLIGRGPSGIQRGK